MSSDSYSTKPRTPWFPSTTHPARRGVYERDHGEQRHYRFRFSHWNGRRWGGWAESPKAAEKNRRWPSERQALPWRGLTLKRAPLPKVDFSGETDCEDQGFSLISDGCLRCVVWVGIGNKAKATHPKFIKQKSPGNASLRGGGPLYWVCPKCKGYYGEVTR